MKDVDIAQNLFNVNITSGFPFYASETEEFLAILFFSLDPILHLQIKKL